MADTGTGAVEAERIRTWFVEAGGPSSRHCRTEQWTQFVGTGQKRPRVLVILGDHNPVALDYQEPPAIRLTLGDDAPSPIRVPPENHEFMVHGTQPLGAVRNTFETVLMQGNGAGQHGC